LVEMHNWFMVMVVEVCKCTKKAMNCILVMGELYFNKAISKREERADKANIMMIEIRTVVVSE